MSVMDGVNRMTQLVGRNRLELLMFRLGGRQRFGINVFKVREVLKRPPLTQVPHSHPVVRGIAHMRDQTIPILDLARAVGRPALDLDSELFVIVTEYNRRIQGFLVSGVDRIVNMNWEQIKPPPKGIGNDNYLTAVTNVDNELVEIIDVEKVMGDVIGEATGLSDAMAATAIPPQEKHVLFVDDSLMARKQIQRVLDQLGLKYIQATNGREGLEVLQKYLAEGQRVQDHISMVLSDVEMPEMDGYTLCKKIKEDDRLRGLTVVLHTSLSGTFNSQTVKRVGADNMLAKFAPDELGRAILQGIGLAETATETADA
ncbi:MAG TPA: chemotaxis protein CheW [Gammaproteobacteria bacterium]|nr:chemotaxis protein CheW [Gammaproteobacteria bacterium]